MASSISKIQDEANKSPRALLEREEARGGAGLVLYIFRVDGDFFLSLLKPPRDTVTKVDVARALYYVRVGGNGVALMVRDRETIANIAEGSIEIMAKGWKLLDVPDSKVTDGVFKREVSNGGGLDSGSFVSAWQGRCTFTAEGRTIVKCVHYPADVQIPSATISELRLHLPSKGHFKGVSDPFGVSSSKRRAVLNKLRRNTRSDSIPDTIQHSSISQSPAIPEVSTLPSSSGSRTGSSVYHFNPRTPHSPPEKQQDTAPMRTPHSRYNTSHSTYAHNRTTAPTSPPYPEYFDTILQQAALDRKRYTVPDEQEYSTSEDAQYRTSRQIMQDFSFPRATMKQEKFDTGSRSALKENEAIETALLPQLEYRTSRKIMQDYSFSAAITGQQDFGADPMPALRDDKISAPSLPARPVRRTPEQAAYEHISFPTSTKSNPPRASSAILADHSGSASRAESQASFSHVRQETPIEMGEVPRLVPREMVSPLRALSPSSHPPRSSPKAFARAYSNHMIPIIPFGPTEAAAPSRLIPRKSINRGEGSLTASDERSSLGKANGSLEAHMEAQNKLNDGEEATRRSKQRLAEVEFETSEGQKQERQSDKGSRERLGGGWRGKDTKLAKLIIYYEGQQMLDLIVAANFVMFWREYKLC